MTGTAKDRVESAKSWLVTWKGIATAIVAILVSVGFIFGWWAGIVRGYDEYQEIRIMNKAVPTILKQSTKRDSLATADRNLLWLSVDTLSDKHKGNVALGPRYSYEEKKLYVRVMFGAEIFTKEAYKSSITGKLSYDHRGYRYNITQVYNP